MIFSLESETGRSEILEPLIHFVPEAVMVNFEVLALVGLVLVVLVSRLLLRPKRHRKRNIFR